MADAASLTETGATPHRAGLVALVGRPNVGKSSLLNHLVGSKVSIVTPKPQTTRWRVLGILTQPATQFVFVDTPGMHRDTPRAVNRVMNRAATGTLGGVDAVVLVVEAGRWTEDDDHALKMLGDDVSKVVVAVNKTDRLASTLELIPFLERLQARGAFAALIPVSARTGDNLPRLLEAVRAQLPESEAIYPADQVSDRDERWLVAELVREQLMLRLEQEVPYSVAVTVDSFEPGEGITRIAATVWVERPGQQPIVVGKGGAMLKEVGTAVRLELEQRWGRKVFLHLWVKVRAGWSDDPRELQTLGLDEP
jgi:GTP-binding protein Era